MNKTYIIGAVVGLLAIFGLMQLLQSAEKRPGPLDDFTQCLRDEGAKFYGAFWCQHCQATKKMFGRSKKLIPYIECSTPDTKKQLQVCTDAGVEDYPTWIFEDGSRKTGELTLSDLAEKTGCILPGESSMENTGTTTGAVSTSTTQ